MNLPTLGLTFVFLLSGTHQETETDREDLSGCKLPSDTTVFPQKDSPWAKDGDIFSFSNNKFYPRPFAERDPSIKNAKDFVERMRASKVGDLTYSTNNNGGFFAVSGRIKDLGKHYLYEFDGKEIPRPDVITGKEDGEDAEGLFRGVKPGNCYFLETMDGKHVLLRFIAIGDRRGTIQWVLQPDESRRFVIPKSIPVPPSSPKVVIPRESMTETVRVPMEEVKKGATITEAVSAHIKYREELVKKLIVVLKENKTSHADKIAAIKTLGELRAEEAVDALINNMHMYEWTPGSITIKDCCPAVGALIKIGKRASIEAISAISLIDSTGVNINDSEVSLRIQSLTIVVRSIEGAEVCRFLLEGKLGKAKPEFKAAIQKALEYLPPASTK